MYRNRKGLAPFDSWMALRPAMVEVWHTRTTSWKSYILDLVGVMEMVLWYGLVQ